MCKLGLIILAGGLSSRMGQPKALLGWTNGESLISHAVRNALEHDMSDILISIGDDESLGQAIQNNIIDTLSNDEKNKISIVRDLVPRSGPLGGLYSALAVGTSPAYGMLAVDMPYMDINLYYDWLYQVDEPWQVIIPKNSDGSLEPMAGIYKPSIVEYLQTVLASDDMSLRHAIEILHPVVTTVSSGESSALRNVNRKEDYQWALAEAENATRLVPLISVVSSKSKTGKTTVVTRLVEELSQRGLEIGVVKSDGHGFTMDHDGTDTAKSFDAGATAVAIAGPTETAIRIRTKEQSNLYQLTQQMLVDLVILETRSQGVFPIIEVVNDSTEALISTDEERVMLVNIEEIDNVLPDVVQRIESMVRNIHESRYR